VTLHKNGDAVTVQDNGRAFPSMFTQIQALRVRVDPDNAALRRKFGDNDNYSGHLRGSSPPRFARGATRDGPRGRGRGPSSRHRVHLGSVRPRARDGEMGLPVALATDFNPGSTMCSSMSMTLTLASRR